jgi:hypothetical protein
VDDGLCHAADASRHDRASASARIDDGEWKALGERRLNKQFRCAEHAIDIVSQPPDMNALGDSELGGEPREILLLLAASADRDKHVRPTCKRAQKCQAILDLIEVADGDQ